MSKAMDPLVDLMQRTDKVRLVGPDTDLTFSIKGIPAVKCDGRCNIPDGEVYTAPVSYTHLDVYKRQYISRDAIAEADNNIESAVETANAKIHNKDMKETIGGQNSVAKVGIISSGSAKSGPNKAGAIIAPRITKPINTVAYTIGSATAITLKFLVPCAI